MYLLGNEVAAATGTSEADVDLKIGDMVRITDDVNLLKKSAKGHGGWVPDMEKVKNDFQSNQISIE
jgi:hypothetical protein